MKFELTFLTQPADGDTGNSDPVGHTTFGHDTQDPDGDFFYLQAADYEDNALVCVAWPREDVEALRDFLALVLERDS